MKTCSKQFPYFLRFLLSLRLKGLDTLESVSQKFKGRFHLLFLVKCCRGQIYCKVKLGGRGLKLVSLTAHKFSLGTITFFFHEICIRN